VVTKNGGVPQTRGTENRGAPGGTEKLLGGEEPALFHLKEKKKKSGGRIKKKSAKRGKMGENQTGGYVGKGQRDKKEVKKKN